MKQRVKMRHEQSGAAFVTAIFLIVVLASLGTFAVRLAAVQQQATAGAIRSTQAMLAAQSGIDWAAHRVRVAS
jgi:MSHA biogenesis protein MshP